MADKAKILRNSYRKLDQLPISFGWKEYTKDMTDTDIEACLDIDLSDAQRIMSIADIESVESDSMRELMVENRVVYFALRRFTYSSSVYFKFSTAVDGKTVDKTQIPKMIKELTNDLDIEFKKYSRGGGNPSTLWNRSVE